MCTFEAGSALSPQNHSPLICLGSGPPNLPATSAGSCGQCESKQCGPCLGLDFQEKQNDSSTLFLLLPAGHQHREVLGKGRVASSLKTMWRKADCSSLTPTPPEILLHVYKDTCVCVCVCVCVTRCYVRPENLFLCH